MFKIFDFSIASFEHFFLVNLTERRNKSKQFHQRNHEWILRRVELSQCKRGSECIQNMPASPWKIASCSLPHAAGDLWRFISEHHTLLFDFVWRRECRLVSLIDGSLRVLKVNTSGFMLPNVCKETSMAGWVCCVTRIRMRTFDV